MAKFKISNYSKADNSFMHCDIVIARAMSKIWIKKHYGDDDDYAHVYLVSKKNQYGVRWIVGTANYRWDIFCDDKFATSNLQCYDFNENTFIKRIA